MTDLYYRPGDIVIADIRNGIENPYATGKARPALILCRRGGGYLVMGFTTKDTYADGAKRLVCPAHREMGMWGYRSFIWSLKPARVAGIDVSHKVGRVNDKLLKLIAKHARWREISVAAFLASVSSSV